MSTQLSMLQQLDSLVVRTKGTEFHGDALALRSDYLWHHQPREDRPGAESIILPIVARYCGVDLERLLSNNREQRVAEARMCAMFVMRTTTSMAWAEIAAAVNRRDHTTSMNGYRKICARAASDPKFRARIQALVDLCLERLRAQAPMLVRTAA